MFHRPERSRRPWTSEPLAVDPGPRGEGPGYRPSADACSRGSCLADSVGLPQQTMRRLLTGSSTRPVGPPSWSLRGVSTQHREARRARRDLGGVPGGSARGSGGSPRAPRRATDPARCPPRKHSDRLRAPARSPHDSGHPLGRDDATGGDLTPLGVGSDERPPVAVTGGGGAVGAHVHHSFRARSPPVTCYSDHS